MDNLDTASSIQRNVGEVFDCCVVVASDDVSDDSMSDESSVFGSDYDFGSNIEVVIKDTHMPDELPRVIPCNDESFYDDPDMPGLVPRGAASDDPDMPGLVPRGQTDEDPDMPGLITGALDYDSDDKDLDLPCVTRTVEVAVNENLYEVCDGELFVSQIIQELEMENQNKATGSFNNLPEYVLDDMPGDVPNEIMGNSANLRPFMDVPAMLIDDDDSVCYPCVTNNTTDEPLPELDETQKSQKKAEDKAKHKLWRTMVGNGIFDRSKIQHQLMSNFLCLQCMHEQLESAHCMTDICLEDAMILATTRNAGFACTLLVRCVHGHHNFTVEPSHVPNPKESTLPEHVALENSVKHDVVVSPNANDDSSNDGSAMISSESGELALAVSDDIPKKRG